MTRYSEFLANKRIVVQPAGIDVAAEELLPALFPFQRDLARWALRKGRSALFADTGLGKTLMQLAWAQHAAERVLILAPLAVARQTVAEGERFGITVTYARSQNQAAPNGITITNYEMLPHFDPAAFGAVVLDESSILKSFEGKTRTELIRAFQQTPMRLCCTATPAPNDIAEIANHAEFLGVMSRTDMLATFFVHDDNGWRLKKHARGPFFRWLASWGMCLSFPSNLGYADDGYLLPPLSIDAVLVDTEYTPPGQLFPTSLKGIQERSAVRKDTLADRVEAVVRLVNSDTEQWIVWCGLNAEQDALAKALAAECVSIDGRTENEDKIQLHELWLRGAKRVLITKPLVFGFGMNWQHCARVAFCGLSDSYEQYYQAIRRCWRFGQRREVLVFIVLSAPEEPIYQNVLRKERDARRMTTELISNVAEFEREEITSVSDRERSYVPAVRMMLPDWLKTA